MTRASQLERIFDAAARPPGVFDPSVLTGVPDTARRWLARAIGDGTPLYSAALLSMHGEIRLGGSWVPFRAKELIRWDRGFVWSARTRLKGIPISGYDMLLDGEGEMRWKLLGVVRIMRASGIDVTRSAMGRLHMEAIWLPTVLVGPGILWSPDGQARATILGHGGRTDVAFDIIGSELRSFAGERWGGPGGYSGKLEPFGGEVLAERKFGLLSLPSEVRVGWYFGTDRFEEGLFFKATLDEARFR